MPLYEYVSDSGKTTLLRRPVDQRDAPVLMGGERFRRQTMPSRFTVGTGARPEQMGEKLRRGYYKLEEQGKLSDKNPRYLPVSKIKEALALPDVHG